jgi:site-specific recombinase XerD
LYSYRNSAEHFLHWLESKNLTLPLLLNKSIIDEFLNNHIPVCQCHLPAPRRRRDLHAALYLLMRMQQEQFPSKPDLNNLSEIDRMVKEFDDYLVKACGLAEGTRLYHCHHVKVFLNKFFSKGVLHLDQLKPIKILSFLYENMPSYKRRTFGLFVYSIRSFFKFLQFKGLCSANFVSVLPRIVEWKHGALPECLNPEELKKLFAAFDRSTSLGKRDYAMITCMVELGLRGYEVANMKLEDINWRDQTLRLSRGKTRQEYLLPIPQSMSDALIDYLQYGRPKTTSRQIFVYHRAPVGKGIKSKIVTDTVRRALHRTNSIHHSIGANLLRRTFATKLLTKGVKIKEIADLLRHRSINTTTIYLKVDFNQLRQVALPWPEDGLW